MSSKSTQLRNQWKELNPEKYQMYLDKQRERAKARRAAKKEKWENEPHTRAMIAEKEKEREQGRNRMRRLSERRRSEGRRVLRRSTDEPGLPSNVKKPKDMTEEERRAHAAELKRQSRARQNPQKKRWAKVKNAEYQRRFREKMNMSTTLNPVPSPSASAPVCSQAPAVPSLTSPVSSTTPPILLPAALQPSPVAPVPSPPALMPSPAAPIPSSLIPTPTSLPVNTQSPSLLLDALDLPTTSATPMRPKKSLWNLTSIIKSSIKKKTKNPQEYAQVVKGLATPKTPEKRAALKDIGVETALVNKDKLPPKQPALPRPSPAGHTVRRRIRLPSLARARAYRDVQAFYFREDVARTLPNKRYATKAGAGRLMLMTIEEAFILFKKHHPEAPVKFTKFYLLKPKTIRLISKGTPETCACMYCLNVRLKNEVLNKVLSANLESFRMPAETKMLDLLLCQKLDNQRWHHHLCLSGQCQCCGDPQKIIHDKFQLYMDEPTSWQHWERISVDGRTRLELISKAGKLRDLLKEYVEKDLKQPAQGSTFVRHLHTFFWQYNQYADLKASLQANEAIMVMDFAENRKASYTVEVKSAHFGKAQITMHPIVCFYMAGEQLRRHSMVFLSDDICHDYHAVHHFTVEGVDALVKAAPGVEKIYIFSDGCAGQYKGKGTFADLSLYTGKRIQRVFFGSEHGKGEADGETGVINCAVDRAVSSGRLTVRNASDLYSWCSQKLTRSDASSLREFFLVPKEDIQRDRPQTDVVTIPGTRRIHQAERVSDYIIRTRNLACFCLVCRRDGSSCLNEAYVGDYTTHKLKHRNTSPLDEAFLEEPEESEPPPDHHHQVQDLDIKVGDFVSVKYTLGKKQLVYNAVVVPPNEAVEEDELLVSFLKSQGSYFIYPEKEEVCLVGKEEVLQVLKPPRVDNRGRHFFD